VSVPEPEAPGDILEERLEDAEGENCTDSERAPVALSLVDIDLLLGRLALGDAEPEPEDG